MKASRERTVRRTEARAGALGNFCRYGEEGGRRTRRRNKGGRRRKEEGGGEAVKKTPLTQ